MDKDISLDNLLSWDGALDGTVKLTFDRKTFELDVKVTNMTNELQKKLEKQSSSMVKDRKSGRIVEEVDEYKFANLQIYNCVVSPDLSNSELQAKFNEANKPEGIVDKIFLPGEKVRLIRTIFSLSGFSDVDIMDMEIENLVNKSND